MFKISGKQKYGGVWADGKCIAKFINGVATTDDPAVAEIMRAQGYTVEGEAPVTDPLAKMSKDDLKAYAVEHGIDLTNVPDKKADILAALTAAEGGQ